MLTTIVRVILVALYAYAGLTVLTSFLWAMGRDQGIMAWVGDVILHGGTPYADAWEQKGPAAHYTYALVELLFGRTVWGIRVADALVLTAVLIPLWRILKVLTDSTLAHFGVLLFLFQYMNLGIWDTAQPDGWASMLLIMAFALQLRPRVGWLPDVAAGALIAWAAAYKFLYAGFLVPLAYLRLAGDGGPLRARLICSGRIVGSFIVVTAAVLGWLCFCHALSEYLAIQLEFNRVAYRSPVGNPLDSRLGLVLKFFMKWGAAVPFVVLGVVRVFRAASLERVRIMSVGMSGLVALAVVVMQNKYFGYHWLPVYFPLVVFTALGIRQFMDIMTTRSVGRPPVSLPIKSWAPLLFALVVLSQIDLVGNNHLREVTLLYRTAMDRESLDRHYCDWPAQPGIPDFSFRGDYLTAQYLRERTAPDDHILVWGAEPMIYYLSGRPAATRFGSAYPLVLNIHSTLCLRYREEFMRELAASQPRYIVVADTDTNWMTPETSRHYLEQFPALNAFLEDGYQPETNIISFALWRRKDDKSH